MNGDPKSVGSRFFEVCLTVLLGALALWGAVEIIRNIWTYLCIGLAIAVLGAAIASFLRTRF